MSAGCPYCNGKATCECKSLAMQHPDLVKGQWDFERNKVAPISVSCSSPLKRWWRYPLTSGSNSKSVHVAT